MSQIPSIDEIVETFELLGDWEERFGYLLDLGRKLPEMPEEERTEEARVHGCQAQVWLRLDVTDGRVRIAAVSDAHLVNGLIAIVMSIYDGKPLQDVLATDAAGVFKKLQLDSHLSGTRRNGLQAMLGRIRELAMAVQR